MTTIAAVAVVAGYIVTIIGALALFRKPIKELSKRVRDVGDGNKCLLRSQITAIYYRHADEPTPKIREYERKNLDELFSAYTALGGNSFVADIYEKMRDWKVVS